MLLWKTGVLSDFSYTLSHLQCINHSSDVNEDQVLLPPSRWGIGMNVTVCYFGVSHLSLQIGFDACQNMSFQTSSVGRSSGLQESPREQSGKVRQKMLPSKLTTNKHGGYAWSKQTTCRKKDTSLRVCSRIYSFPTRIWGRALSVQKIAIK